MLLATALAAAGDGNAAFLFENWATPAAIGTILAGLGGWAARRQSKKGQAETQAEQKAANQIKADQQQFEQQQALIATHVAEIERTNAARLAEQDRHDVEMDRMRKAMDTERARQAIHDAAQSETIELLRSIISSEINKASADAAIAMGVVLERATEDVLLSERVEQTRQNGHDQRTLDARQEET